MVPESMLEKLVWGIGILATAACMAARAHAAVATPTLPPQPPVYHAIMETGAIAGPLRTTLN